VLLFVDDVFAPHVLADSRTTEVLHAATDRAAGRVRTSDLLHALISSGDLGVRAALALSLTDGAQLQDVLDGIDLYSPARAGGADFDGRRDRFTDEALEALDAFAAELAGQFPADPAVRAGVDLELLAACVVEHLDEQDRRYLPILDAERAAAALREQIRIAVKPLPSLVDRSTGRLRAEEFSSAAWAALELAAERAAELGYDRVLPPHCLLGLIGETEGLAERLIRLQLAPQVGLAKVAASIIDAFRRSDRSRAAALPLSRDAIDETTIDLLRRAQRAAAIRVRCR
jgi:hypothetical protein